MWAFTIFAVAMAWIVAVSWLLPKGWYKYRVSRLGRDWLCEKKLKFIGIFWHTMTIDGFFTDVFGSREEAEYALKQWLSLSNAN